MALVIVNKGNTDKVITVSTDSNGVGNKYYIYSFTGGTDSDLSPNVYINGTGPDFFQVGPYDELSDIKADGYTIDGEIKFDSPANSVQMILIEGGTNHVIVDDSMLVGINYARSDLFKLNQNFPNPVVSNTQISYQLQSSAFVTLNVFDFQGREITTLVNERQNPGNHSVQFNVSDLPNGVYFYRVEAGKYYDVKKLIVLK